MGRRAYAGGADTARLTTPIVAATTSIPIDTVNGWPATSADDYAVVFDFGGSNEQKGLVTARSGTDLTVTRGYDDTTATDLPAGTTVQLAITATDLDEANEHINDDTLDHHTQYALVDGTRAFTGTVTVNGRIEADDEISIDGSAGSDREIDFDTDGDNRWELAANSTAEAGSDAGSDFEVRAYDDNGTLIDTPVTIVRAADGDIDLARPLDMGSNVIKNVTDPTNNQDAATKKYVDDNASSGYSGAVVSKTGAQSIANNTSTKLTWETSERDTDSLVDLANNEIDVPVGVTVIRGRAAVAFDVSSTGNRQARVMKNGVDTSPESKVFLASVSTNQPIYVIVTAPITVEEGDVITLEALQTSGGALDVVAAGTWFEVEVLG